MAATFTLISSVTVGAGGAASMAFTSIPATYTDLVLKVSPRFSAASTNKTLVMRFNSDASTSNYKNRRLQGNGSTASSSIEEGYNGGYISEVNAGSSTASTFSNVEIYIPNYAGSTNKSFSVDSAMENNATTAYAQLLANLWNNTAAITSITLVEQGSDNFVQYSTAYLYGISNA